MIANATSALLLLYEPVSVLRGQLLDDGQVVIATMADAHIGLVHDVGTIASGYDDHTHVGMLVGNGLEAVR